MGRTGDPDDTFVGLTLPTVVEKHPHFVGIATPEGDVCYLNPAARALLGWSDAEVAAATVFDVHPGIDHDRLRRTVLPAIGRDEVWQGDLHLVNAAGEQRTVEVTAFGICRPGDRAPSFIAAAMQDITERRAEAVAASRERSRSIAAERIAGLGYWEWEIGSDQATWSPQMYKIFGRDPAAGPFSPAEFLAAVHPADRERVAAAIARSAELGHPYENEYRVTSDDGGIRLLRAIAVVERGMDGALDRMVGVNFDVTEQAELQRQLRAADRLGAVGQLAGGIAHDFNNILTAITGHADLARGTLEASDPLHADMDQIIDGCRRAGELTRQLLAFSGRQLLAPRVVSLNRVIHGLEPMLHRLIPENVTITSRLARDLPRVRADVTQLEQVILNLALNARDAMPDGGSMTIETAVAPDDGPTAEPGILLTLRDDGVGMSENVLRHACEPFFTTKPVGEGGGMGLATVYGIIRQSGGAIDIDSAPGQGTIVRIRLPASDAPADPWPSSDVATSVGGSEAILLVEDNPAVRELARRCLTGAGYRVATTRDAEAAIDLLASADQEVDILVTDVVLPGMNGHDLARRVQALRPDVRVLYISGYPGSVIAEHGIFDPESHVLAKPFSPDALKQKVRQVLETPQFA